MSVNMAVWEGDRPETDADAAQMFESLYARYLDGDHPTEPTPKLTAFAESGPLIYFAMVANEASARAWDLATSTAAQLGLVAFDPQTGRLVPS